jgi:hypothetical protein
MDGTQLRSRAGARFFSSSLTPDDATPLRRTSIDSFIALLSTGKGTPSFPQVTNLAAAKEVLKKLVNLDLFL